MGYKIYRNSTLLTTVSGSTISYLDKNLTSGKTYSYFVVAYDAAGNQLSHCYGNSTPCTEEMDYVYDGKDQLRRATKKLAGVVQGSEEYWYDGSNQRLATVKRDQLEGRGESWPAEDEEAFKDPIREQYERQGSAYYATARLWDDGVIDPMETRQVLGLALTACANAPLGQKDQTQTQFGVFRM